MNDDNTRPDDFGQVIDDAEGRASVRFRRVLKAPIDAVWRALTEPAELTAWLEVASIEPAEGGAVSIEFDDGPVTGRVTIWQPPHLLEYTWLIAGESESVVRFELSSTGSGTRLDLEHIRLPGSMGAGYGAGWHAHLDRLEDHLTGRRVRSWNDRFEVVLGRYRSPLR